MGRRLCLSCSLVFRKIRLGTLALLFVKVLWEVLFLDLDSATSNNKNHTKLVDSVVDFRLSSLSKQATAFALGRSSVAR